MSQLLRPLYTALQRRVGRENPSRMTPASLKGTWKMSALKITPFTPNQRGGVSFVCVDLSDSSLNVTKGNHSAAVGVNQHNTSTTSVRPICISLRQRCRRV